jgi:hypothetical protein
LARQQVWFAATQEGGSFWDVALQGQQKLENNEGRTGMWSSKLRVKAVIFDLDGTLVDSTEAYREAAKIAVVTTGDWKMDARTVMEIPRRLEQNLPIDDLIVGTDVDPQTRLNQLAQETQDQILSKMP